MDQSRYFHILMHVSTWPAMYSVQDAMDLSTFLTGYRAGANDARLERLLSDLTNFANEKLPYSESQVGWSHLVKAGSWERGGSIKLFRQWLGQMLVEQGHWTDEHFLIFTSDKTIPPDTRNSLPPPRYSDLPLE